MMQKPYRVSYTSLGDTWCRYFVTHKQAVRFMQHKQSTGYQAHLTYVPEI